jgi:hypothetical protein
MPWPSRRPCSYGPPMGRQIVDDKIVDDDEITIFEGRRELFFDISLEDAPVHRALTKGVAAQAGDKSLTSPMPERRL